MKKKPVLKSLADLYIEGLSPDPDKPAQGNSEPISGDAKTTTERENQAYITVTQRSGFANYRHWGLNE